MFFSQECTVFKGTISKAKWFVFFLHHLDLQVKICQLFSICLVNDKIIHVNLSEQNVLFLKLLRSSTDYFPFLKERECNIRHCYYLKLPGLDTFSPLFYGRKVDTTSVSPSSPPRPPSLSCLPTPVDTGFCYKIP